MNGRLLYLPTSTKSASLTHILISAPRSSPTSPLCLYGLTKTRLPLRSYRNWYTRLSAVEFLFQRNAYHPFAQCSHPQKHSDPVPLTEILPNRVGATIAEHRMLHYCPHQACASLDPDNFCFNRKEVNNMDFLDKLKIFAYTTIGLGETIRNPIKTFRELSRYVGRMANQKASGDDKMAADLFKKAPEAFRKRAWILINIILAGHHVCNEELLEARVVLLCKDHCNPILLANFRPIALCNSFYKLINTIITSRIRGLTERYAVLESSQHGFRGSRSVQLRVLKDFR